MFEEAKETEYWNLIDLECLFMLEVEMKKKVLMVLNVYEGLLLVYCSLVKVDEGVMMIEFARGVETFESLR